MHILYSSFLLFTLLIISSNSEHYSSFDKDLFNGFQRRLVHTGSMFHMGRKELSSTFTIRTTQEQHTSAYDVALWTNSRYEPPSKRGMLNKIISEVSIATGISRTAVKGAQTTGNNASKSGSKTSGAGQNALTPTARTGPMIDKPSSKNVTALLGKTAYLNCKVKNLGNKTISWVRHRDIHLLTVGRYTYTSDQRFRAIHHAGTEDWSLQIKYPQHRDSGIYECQISTTPHMSHFIHLNVVEPTTDIIGGPDLYIDRGSTINLTCVVLFSPEPPAYIFWNHNDAIISYDSPRGGVSVITEKGETTTSFLLIQHAKPTDSGRYQCNPSNAQSKSVNVHVLNGTREVKTSKSNATRIQELPERDLMVLQFEETRALISTLSKFTRRIDQWEINFERISFLEEENNKLASRIEQLETRLDTFISLQTALLQSSTRGSSTSTTTPTTPITENYFEDPTTQTVPTETSEDETTEEVTTEALISTTDLPDTSSMYYQVSEAIKDVIEDLEESTTNNDSEENLFDESTTLVDYDTSTMEADYESSTVDPDEASSGDSTRGKNTAILVFMMYNLVQFPAAMQHGGQAHHRSSHLYCLIFCVCLLLFST